MNHEGSTWARTIGAIALKVATISSAALVWMHLSGHALPGCGAGSACGRLGESRFSSIPLPTGELPVSMLGLAFFIALLIGWLRGGTANPSFRWLVRLGAAASVFFIGVAFAEQLFCQYCMAAHAANLLAWLVMEFGTRAKISPKHTLVPVLASFVGVLLLQVGADWGYRAEAEAEQEAQLEESIAKLVPSSQPAAPSDPPSANDTADAPVVAKQSSAEDALPPPIVGRWRIGPEEAVVRIVMFVGYQCGDCKRLDNQALALADKHDNVSLSIRHFPMHPDCNTSISRAMHGNACWAARAAETAGWIGGDDGFFRMHRALFKRSGKFESTADLHAAVQEAGLDVAEFMQVFQDRELRTEFDALIRDDAAEAVALGLHFTPMIFINGVELKGWAAPQALTRAVNAVLESGAAPATAGNDRPPRALDKYIADWADSVRVKIPDPMGGVSMGVEQEPAVRVVLWGDYTDKTTGEADALLRAAVARRGDMRYTFRHFPLDQDCNPRSPVDRNDSCLQHEGMAALGAADPEAFWKVHAWLLASQQYTGDALRSALRDRGVTTELLSRPDGPDALAADANAWVEIQATAKRANRLHRQALPTIVLNGRIIPRWKIGGQPVLDALLDAAGEGK